MLIYDFSFFLFLATVITGVIWAVDSYLLAPRRNAVIRTESDISKGVEVSRGGKEPSIVEYSKSFFPVLLVVFLLRGFLVEPFRIPSGSMLPSLYIGDFILVNKFSYGIRIPVVNEKIIPVGEPQRGDVVVFRFPREVSVNYIKRIVGLPGDHIEYYNKVLKVNGVPVQREFIGQYSGPGQQYANEYRDELGDKKHRTLLMPGKPNTINGEWIVPEGMYFAMGDNRDNSNDSRGWGMVPDSHLVGKAFMIWMHIKDWDVRWSRIGNMID